MTTTDSDPVTEMAGWLLAGLGAEVRGGQPATDGDLAVGVGPRTGAGPGAGPQLGAETDRGACRRTGGLMRRSPDTGLIAAAGHGLPAGVVDYACGAALALAGVAGWITGDVVQVSELGVAIQVWLPEVMAAAYRSPTAMRPPGPIAAPGGGWFHADLGAPGDREEFEGLLRILDETPGRRDAAELAAAAQEWRLPVCDYRTRLTQARLHPVWWAPREREPMGWTGPVAGKGQGPPLAGVRVCDLTTMWAGPLATWLLMGLGASVDKVEPAFRPDGTRAMAGGGIYPDGLQSEPGRDSAMFNALNRGKRIAPLDLRVPSDREAFVALAGSADVVIDSFSPRVMPNFGLGDQLGSGPGRPALVSIPAFGPGPQRNWVAYGTGVHAAAGLGDIGGGRFEAPTVSYPDPLAGFVTALAVTAAVVGRDRGRPASRVEVPLAGACQPLLGRDAGPPRRGDGPAMGSALLEAGRAQGLLEPHRVAGLDLSHPVCPLVGAGWISLLDETLF